jgi:molecular chaperone DnaJ
MFRITEAGLPNLRSRQRGDLVVIVQLVVPKKLSEAQRALLSEYAETEDLDFSEEAPSLWEKIKDAVTGG